LIGLEYACWLSDGKERKSMKKYQINSDGRVVALRDFGDVKTGDVGGFIESEANLSHDGNCWIYGEARVFDDAQVSENAHVFGHAQVSENAQVSGHAEVSGHASVFGNARVFGKARVSGKAWVFGEVQVSVGTKLSGDAVIC
jgi:UDP-3-O-[3-hydroxymyristoyl] glucosamine N-acyltransferase